MIHIFFISLTVSVLLVLGKIWELKTGKRSVFSIVLSKIDPLIQKIISFAKIQFEHNRKKAIFLLLVDLPIKVERFVAGLRDRAHKRYRNTVLGVKEHQENGESYQPSAFMRNMSQIKKGNGMLDE